MFLRLASRAIPALAPCLLAIATIAAATGCSDSTSTATPVPQFTLTETGTLPSGSTIASLHLAGERSGIALMNAFGTQPTERIIPFDPMTGTLGVSVTATRPLTFSPALANKAGTPVSSTVTSFPAFALVEGAKLYVTCSNLSLVSPPFGTTYNPGAVLVFDYDLARNRVGALRTTIVLHVSATAYYNPAAIVGYSRGSARRLAIVCGDDPFAFGAPVESAVVVVNPITDTIESVASLGACNASAGEAAFSAGRLYVGSATAPEVYVVNLSTATAIVERGAANPVVLPSSRSTHLVGDLEVSADGSALYALHANDGALHVLSLNDPANPLPVTFTAGLKRSSTNDFEALGQALARRPGRPGIDFQGEDLFVATIIIATPDQSVTGVRTAVDALTSRGVAAPTLRLDALVDPFTPASVRTADIQHLAVGQAGATAGFLYAVEGQTGKVVARRLVDIAR